MEDQIGKNLLEAALIAAQKVEKKFRQLRNRGDATDRDVADAKKAVEMLRDISRRHGIAPIDWDGGDRPREERPPPVSNLQRAINAVREQHLKDKTRE